MSRLAVAVLAAAAAAGCGPSIEVVCTDSANAHCAKIDACRLNGVATAYGTLAVCLQRVHDNCVASLQATGTGNSAGAVSDCAKALPDESCQDYEENNPMAACAQKLGYDDDGISCAFNGQCKSGFCGVPQGSACGVCAPVPQAGDACADVTNCGPNMTCAPQQVCEPYVAVGGACDGNTLTCAPNSYCVIAAGAATGTCQAAIESAGGACDPKKQTAAGCDTREGFWCAQGGQCVAIDYVGAGSSCGSQSGGSGDNVCSAGSSCWKDVNGDSFCLPLATEGQPCDLDLGPGCMSPARCVLNGLSATSGVCALPTGLLCQQY